MGHGAENRLAQETSPYLLQHARNPVDWYPWGPEALQRAKQEDRPIFLSIGYSACHWCHVMERECFEDESIARLMNRLFVNIKVDREERPDVDEIYMKAVVAMTGSGGWPMSVFLTPDLEPFFGATYLPPVRAHGRPSFPDVLTGLADAWKNERDAVLEQGSELTRAIRREAAADLSGSVDADGILERSREQLAMSFDSRWGGFGTAPKFPHSGDIRALLRHWRRGGDESALHMASFTLDRMALGGMYDQLGGGFHRYSTDEQWRIPHFEKMLYDNALLVTAYTEAHVATGSSFYAGIVQETCDWALREMVTATGGFASAQDADSEGEEGRFFAWTPAELVRVLGEERGRWAKAYFGVTDTGNFEHGRSALWHPNSFADVARELDVSLEELESAMREARKQLFDARRERVAPATDDKVLVSWNALMVSALAQAFQVLGTARYLEAAITAARHVLNDMCREDGRLWATEREGRAHINACLDDYAYLVQALIDLYESDFDPSWLAAALEFNALIETDFRDAELGGYFSTGEGHERLIARLKPTHDGALPAGIAVQALNLLRLGHLTSDAGLIDAGRAAIASQGKILASHPRVFSHMVLALDFDRARPREIVVSGRPDAADTVELLRTLRTTFAPQRVVALASEKANAAMLPLLQGREPADVARVFICRDSVCDAPLHDARALRAALAVDVADRPDT